ncbi:unnamed protein product [Dibothriocephalus latus]|uniref:Uncharacterized protein n=1 Tax=Dibothriocephalus latus TaxID=60516 RepID=A0A3P6SD06_DIBLA|nr:unnamed protein product [Dibothriocephalus latus]
MLAAIRRETGILMISMVQSQVDPVKLAPISVSSYPVMGKIPQRSNADLSTDLQMTKLWERFGNENLQTDIKHAGNDLWKLYLTTIPKYTARTSMFSDFDDDMKLAEDIRHCVDDLSGCESESTVNGRVSGAYASQPRGQQRGRAAESTGQPPNVLDYQSPPPIPQGKSKQRRQTRPTGIEPARQPAFPKKHGSRPRATQQRGHLSEMKAERLTEEESMIALTVPPASDWGSSPAQSNERTMSAQQAKMGITNQSQEPVHIRKSDESDKESVIIMDIHSSSNRKVTF